MTITGYRTLETQTPEVPGRVRVLVDSKDQPEEQEALWWPGGSGYEPGFYRECELHMHKLEGVKAWAPKKEVAR